MLFQAKERGRGSALTRCLISPLQRHSLPSRPCIHRHMTRSWHHPRKGFPAREFVSCHRFHHPTIGCCLHYIKHGMDTSYCLFMNNLPLTDLHVLLSPIHAFTLSTQRQSRIKSITQMSQAKVASQQPNSALGTFTNLYWSCDLPIAIMLYLYQAWPCSSCQTLCTRALSHLDTQNSARWFWPLKQRQRPFLKTELLTSQFFFLKATTVVMVEFSTITNS